jgi:BMFP domain-containing protein YqiC
MTSFSDDEKKALRNAAFGAVFLVSNADPGMFDMIKESFAASKSFAKAGGDLQDVFKGMSMPSVPKGSKEQVEQGILSQLSASVSTLQTRSPEELDAYRQVVLDACTSTAEAAKGVAPEETAALSKVKSALGAG